MTRWLRHSLLLLAFPAAVFATAPNEARAAVCPELRSGGWSGSWVQTVPVPGSGTWEISTRFTDDAIAGTATFSQDLGGTIFSTSGPISGPVTCADVEFTAVLNGVANSFTGTLSADGTSISGLWFRYDPYPLLIGGTWTGSVTAERPVVAVGETVVFEGDSGTQQIAVPVVLSKPAASTVTVQYATADYTATAGTDYLARSGTVTFAPGTVVRWINVPVLGDDIDEPDELAFVALSNAVGAGVEPALGGGVMIYDRIDTLPGVEFGFSFGNLYEGDSGRPVMKVNATLSAASATTVSVEWATGDGTAVAPTDYLPKSGVVNFAPGQTRKVISLPIRGDITPEVWEWFGLHVIDITPGVAYDIAPVPIGIYDL